MSSSTASPSTSSRTWLVHRIRSGGAASSRRTASAAAASSTCSQLSRITTAAEALSRSSSAASPPVTCSAAITVSRTSSAVVAVSSLASQTPPGARRPTGQPATGGDRDGGLADPARSDDLDQPLACEQVRHGGDLASRGRRARPTSDGRFPARRVVFERSRGTIADAEGRVLDQDPSLELLQPGSGSETEFVREQGADPLVGRQRVGLTSRPVQRGDQQLPQAFLVGIRRHRGLQLADQLARASEPQAAPRTASPSAPCAPRRAAPGTGRPSRRRPGGDRRGSAPSADALSSAAPRSSPASSSSAAVAASRSTASASTSDALDGERVPAVTADDRPADPRTLAAAWRSSTAACCGAC